MFLIGHRGARKEAPENTIMGFEHLRDLGINSAEFDLHLSKDKKIVIIHDETLDRTTKGKGKVCNYTAEELKAFDVPELKEVLSVFKHIDHVQLEVKSPKKKNYKIICELIASTLKELKLEKSCVITSFDIDFLKSAEKHASHLRRGLIYQKGRIPRALSENSVKTLLEITKKLNVQLLAINHKNCTRFLIEQAKANNLEISSWTVNTKADFLRLKKWGIDSIITDRPSKLKQLLD